MLLQNCSKRKMEAYASIITTIYANTALVENERKFRTIVFIDAFLLDIGGGPDSAPQFIDKNDFSHIRDFHSYFTMFLKSLFTAFLFV